MTAKKQLRFTKNYSVEWWTHELKRVTFFTQMFGWYERVDSTYHVVSYDNDKKTTSYYLNGVRFLSQRKRVTPEQLKKLGVPIPDKYLKPEVKNDSA